MLNDEMREFMQDNGLVRIQASPMSEALDLWECPGGHVWTLEQIQIALEDYKYEQAQDAMADSGPA